MSIDYVLRPPLPPDFEPALTPRVGRVLELASEEAKRLGHPYIGTEHLLLGLMLEGDGIAAGVLMSLGLDLTKVRGAIEFICPAQP